MIERPVVSYCLTILVFCCIIYIPQLGASVQDEVAGSGGMVNILSTLGLGLLAAIPAFAVWGPLWVLLNRLGIAQICRAVLAAGPTAFLVAYGVNHFIRKLSSGFGAINNQPNMHGILIVFLVAVPVVFGVWVFAPKESEQI
ncbi:MAG: hypothetical protein ABJL67_22630 [Sulfitobacter sp.]